MRFSSYVRVGVNNGMESVFGWTFPPWVTITLAAVFVNLFCFLLCGMTLYQVVLIMTRSVKISLLAVSIFAFNPASIFFSSAYSESVTFEENSSFLLLNHFQMFFTMTLTGFVFMLFGLRGKGFWHRMLKGFTGTICFGLTFAVRSNGLLNFLYVAWIWCGTLLWDEEMPIPDCHKLISTLAATKNERYKQEWQAKFWRFQQKRKQNRKVFRWTDPNFSRCVTLFIVIVCAISATLLFFTPYVFMTNFTADEFCKPQDSHKQAVETIAKTVRLSPKTVSVKNAWEKTTWCKKPKLFGIIARYYGEIQTKYWSVKFFGYWKIKKIPCFLMMLPAAILTVLAIKSSWNDVFLNKRSVIFFCSHMYKNSF